MGRSKCLALVLAAAAAAGAGSYPAAGQCRLCAVPTTSIGGDTAGRDMTVEIETSINFDRLVVAANGTGSAVLRPDGSASVDGAVEAVSPRTSVGSAVVHGEPGRAVRIELPSRIVLTSGTGAEILLEDVVSDLPSLPRLDSAGRLTFRFGGRLRVRGDAEGSYRGDLPITVEYL